MKKLVIIFLFLAVVVPLTRPQWQPEAGKLYYRYIYVSKCDQPVKYQIGSIDSRFNISKNNLQNDLKSASDIWNEHSSSALQNDAGGKPLLVYDPKADLTINMVYDERQSLNTQLRQIQGNLNQEEQSIKPQITEYQKQVVEFKQKIAQLNQQIETWNSQGGAPPDVYNQLKQQQADLQAEASRLNSMARSLNQSTENYNQDINKFNQTVDTFNQALQQKPEEGLYKPQEGAIDIYVFDNQNEFIHTLAHELGHALGLDHNPNKAAIMYPYTTRSTTLTADDLNALTVACQRQNILNIFLNRFQVILDYYRQQLGLGVD